MGCRARVWAATRRRRGALALCAGLTASPDILDIGCGPGRQSLVLARATGGQVTAVDLHAEFLEEVRQHAATAGLGDRLRVVQADMRDLPFEPASFDLIWSEGAAYAMGVAEALVRWRPLLRPGGYLGYSDLVWTGDVRPTDVQEFFATGYPEMTDVGGNLRRITEAGYALVGQFRLPESAWWDEYYTPLEARLPGLRERYRSDDAALSVIGSTAREIELRRRYPDSYGYQFSIARRPDHDEVAIRALRHGSSLGGFVLDEAEAVAVGVGRCEALHNGPHAFAALDGIA